MSTNVEDEIVSMKFENRQFEAGVKATMGTLDRLKQALVFPLNGIGSGLSNITSNIKGFNLNPLVDSASEVGKAFSAMSVVAISAIATIASKATTAGLGLAKSLSLGPITDGFSEYNTTLNSVQTILSNTGLEGQKGLDRVNQSLGELNTFSDKTIYNFSEMARNIGTFTAAGIDLDTSVGAIKGIADLAAVSGSSADQASTAMYQLSQALSTGTVRLMDWNSVSNAGLGGKVFKDSVMETARAHGIAIDEIVKKNGSFRDSLQEGWFSADILTETLQKFTGDLTDEQLKSMNYNAEQIKGIQKLGKMATDAATKVKTLPQLMGTIKEAIGSGWSNSFRLIFGDFGEAKTTFTALNDYLGQIITRSATQRNKMLEDWKALNGRTVLILAIKHAWEALLGILNPIRKAFREVFPASTGKDLKHLTAGINRFFKALILSKDAQENLKDTFAGLFAVLHIGISLFKGVVTILGRVIGLFLKGQGSTLAFTGGIGSMLVALDKFLTGGGRMEKFFDVVGDAITGVLKPIFDFRSAIIGAFVGLVTLNPSKLFDNLRGAIQSVLGLVDNFSQGFANAFNAISGALGGVGNLKGFDLAGMFGGATGGAASGATKSIENVKESLGGVASIGDRVKSVWSAILGFFQSGFNKVQSAIERVKNAFGTLASAFGKGFSKAGDGANSIAASFRGLGDAFKGNGDLLASIRDLFSSILTTLSNGITNTFSNLGKGVDFSDLLGAIQTVLFIQILRQVKDFTGALADISDSASKVLGQVTSNLKTMQADVRANIILQIAGSLLLLSAAIYLLSKTEPKKLAAGLAAISALLLELVFAMKALEKGVGSTKAGAKLVLVSAALVGLSVALFVMALAVKQFASLDKGELFKGMFFIGIALAGLVSAAKALTKGGVGANMVGAATGILILSFALITLLGAIKIYTKIDAGTLAEGMVKIAGVLLVLSFAMKGMQSSVGGAVAMAIVSVGLIILAKALQMFSDIPADQLKKSIFAMAVSLAVLAIAVNVMSGAISGAVALVVVAFGLGLLVPVLLALGNLSWETIGKGLIALGGAMLILAVGTALMSPLIPILLALGGALALIGLAIFLAGTGIAAFATGLALLATNGKAGFGVLLDIINSFLDKLPDMVHKFGETISAIADVIGERSGEIVTALGELLNKFLDSIAAMMPHVKRVIRAILKAMIQVVMSFVGDFADAGLKLIKRFIKSLDDKLPEIVTAARRLIQHFLESIGENAVKLANAAGQIIVDFLNGLRDAIELYGPQIRKAMKGVGKAIVDQTLKPLKNLADDLWHALQDAFDAAVARIKVPSLPNFKIPKPHIPTPDLNPFNGRLDPNALFGTFALLVSSADNTADEVGSAIDSIKSQIDDTFTKAKSDIDKFKNKLDKKGLSEAEKKKFKAAKKAAQQTKDDAEAAKKAYKTVNNTAIPQLRILAANYDAVTGRINTATAALDEFRKGIVDAFATAPDIESGQTLASYMKQLATQTGAVNKFKTTLATLRSQGLDDATYRYFLDQGVDAQKVMDGLVAGGPGAITAFENATQGLTAAGDGLAKMASSALGYDKAVETAKNYLSGIAEGLADPNLLANIQAQMTQLAGVVQTSINKKLKIKSPSRVAMETGRYFVLGLASGLGQMHNKVASSAETLGGVAMDTLQTTLSNLGNGLDDAISLTPVITPVLDLAQLTKDANGISSILTNNPLIPSTSYQMATGIANASDVAKQAAADALALAQAGVGDPRQVVFEQNNYSPKALTPVEIFRNTRNQLSQAKEALSKP